MKIGMREVRWFHRKQPHHINCVRFPVTAGLPVHLKHSPIRQLGTENIQSASKERGTFEDPAPDFSLSDAIPGVLVELNSLSGISLFILSVCFTKLL